MAHEIETFDDGTAAFFTARTDAWHRLGVTTRDCLTAEQVMTTARLGGWNVHTVPLTATDLTADGVTTLPVPDHFATVRTHPVSGKPDVLGVVGSGYTVVQNEEHCELLNLLVDEAGAHFETAGSLRGGRETFVTMKLPQSITLQGTNGSRRHRAVPGRHVQPRRDRRLAGHRHPRAHRLRQHPTHGPPPGQGDLRDPAHPHRQGEDRPGPPGPGHRVALRRGLRDRRPAADQPDARPGRVPGHRRPALAAPTPPTSPAPAPRASATAATPPCAACSPRPTPSTTIRGTRWAGLQAITEYLDHHTPAKDDDVRATRVLTSHALGERKQRAYDLLAAH